MLVSVGDACVRNSLTIETKEVVIVGEEYTAEACSKFEVFVVRP